MFWSYGFFALLRQIVYALLLLGEGIVLDPLIDSVPRWLPLSLSDIRRLASRRYGFYPFNDPASNPRRKYFPRKM